METYWAPVKNSIRRMPRNWLLNGPATRCRFDPGFLKNPCHFDERWAGLREWAKRNLFEPCMVHTYFSGKISPRPDFTTLSRAFEMTFRFIFLQSRIHFYLRQRLQLVIFGPFIKRQVFLDILDQ